MARNIMSLFSLSSFMDARGLVWVVAALVTDARALAQGHSLDQRPGSSGSIWDRNDDSRSQFGGASMRRIQSPAQTGRSAPLPASSLSVGSMPGPRGIKDVPVMGVYLNGTNIVGLRNQTLKGVTVRFDDHGNILIDAPHYEVKLDTSFHPLLPGEIPGRSKETAPWPADDNRQPGRSADPLSPSARMPQQNSAPTPPANGDDAEPLAEP
jgi:hypothetical protein